MTSDRPKDVELRVGAEETGERLDKLVVRSLGALGRRGVAELFRRGAIRVGGHVARKGDRARAGDVVTIATGDAEEIASEPDAPLDVRLVVADVVVVDKPSGQPTAPVRLGERGTLAGALLGRFPEVQGIGHRAREPGLLHRLDTQTSGLLVAARTGRAFEHLWKALSSGRIEKRYLALVESAGLSEAGVIDTPLVHDPSDPRRVVVAAVGAGGARAAVTRWSARRVGTRLTLVEARVAHAYRHQIRAHLASIGHPIVGDRIYGGASVPGLGERHALHASYVAWAGDDVVPAFAVESELPAELAALLDAG